MNGFRFDEDRESDRIASMTFALKACAEFRADAAESEGLDDVIAALNASDAWAALERMCDRHLAALVLAEGNKHVEFRGDDAEECTLRYLCRKYGVTPGAPVREIGVAA